MSVMGIYFGPTLISAIESRDKRVLSHFQVPRAKITSFELEQKVPEEVKMVTLFKDELSKNKIGAKEVALVLSGKDLIIRTFEMPLLSPKEMRTAVNFEVKRYMPFKVEDLVSDFQVEFDKSTRKNLVLFVGIKKDLLAKYLSVLNQLDLRVAAVEYSGFSALRLLKLNNLGYRGIIAIISVDPREKDEAHFMVLDNGFPLFSRDITLVGDSGSDKILEKLKTELRISLDFYHRKFPAKNIGKTFFISAADDRPDLETIIKEINLSPQFQFIEAMKYIERAVPFSLGLVKGYCGSLSKIIKIGLKINLLAAGPQIKHLKKTGIQVETIPLPAGLKIEPKIVILGLLICVLTFTFGLSQKLALQRELRNVALMQPQVSTISAASSYEELIAKESEYKQKIEAVDNLLKKQLCLTSLLDIIPRIMPKGMWLIELSFATEENKTNLILRGAVFFEDSDKELQIVNTFILNLKKNPTFSKYFKEIDIVSVEHSQIRNTAVTNFVISCRSYKERK